MSMQEKLASRSRGTEHSKIRQVAAMIQRNGGIDLGQGTCALPPHPYVLEAGQRAIAHGFNTYTASDGIRELKDAIVRRYAAYNQLQLETANILVTCGATGAFESICKCFLEPGDEVILLEPSYLGHLKQIADRGAVARYVRLHAPAWTLDFGDLERAITPRTKLLVISNPNNPTGKVFTRHELQTIGEICKRAGVIVISDEVYEYILAEDRTHISIASLPGMFDHAITISSASKTLFVTGWRIGWAVAPPEIIRALAIKSDETYVCAPAPLQKGVADSLCMDEEFFTSIRLPFQQMRRKLCEALRDAGLTPSDPDGTYYVLAGYEQYGFKDDDEAMLTLMKNTSVACVPGNAFYPTGTHSGLLRFCFAVEDSVLDEACKRLRTTPSVCAKAACTVA